MKLSSSDWSSDVCSSDLWNRKKLCLTIKLTARFSMVHEESGVSPSTVTSRRKPVGSAAVQLAT